MTGNHRGYGLLLDVIGFWVVKSKERKWKWKDTSGRFTTSWVCFSKFCPFYCVDEQDVSLCHMSSSFFFSVLPLHIGDRCFRCALPLPWPFRTRKNVANKTGVACTISSRAWKEAKEVGAVKSWGGVERKKSCWAQYGVASFFLFLSFFGYQRLQVELWKR